ncbi:pentapeptide repeat-containing protein [Streptomyces sp. NBC_00199]|uniref:pentapeptide repeat-containing protein n=1 Tax=Streptomyces sp. NBC_00199 TaxID=2975678 RepID=UPI00225C0746|nr:pentapeptide repeat-containing protein [Streptomyces sp. NBC_00199]MCX5263587.1 pentapeptide repeat-containing protein [Streptomyces sp. NBC_00199]
MNSTELLKKATGLTVDQGNRKLRKPISIAVLAVAAAGLLAFLIESNSSTREAFEALVAPWRRLYWDRLDASAKAQTEGQIRLAVVQTLAALGALCALIYTARTYRLSRRGQVTDRFNKALERIDSDEIYVRIGGILALGEVMDDYPERSLNAFQVLSTFLYSRTSVSQPADVASFPREPESDTQLALKVLTTGTRRRASNQSISLKDLHLVGVDLRGADLRNARLQRSNLRGADLEDADLRGATLHRTDFRGSTVSRANFREADLYKTDFRNSWLSKADFRGASMEGVQFDDAVLDWADFRGAHHLASETISKARSLLGVKLDKAVAEILGLK